MTWKACRPWGVNRRHYRRPSRRALATDAAPISGLPALGRAFAALPAGCGLVADLLAIPQPKNWPPLSRAVPRKRPGEAIIGLVAGPAVDPLGPFFYLLGTRRPVNRPRSRSASSASALGDRSNRPPRSSKGRVRAAVLSANSALARQTRSARGRSRRAFNSPSSIFNSSHGHRGRRPKAFREGTRGMWAAAMPRALWGFQHGC